MPALKIVPGPARSHAQVASRARAFTASFAKHDVYIEPLYLMCDKSCSNCRKYALPLFQVIERFDIHGDRSLEPYINDCVDDGGAHQPSRRGRFADFRRLWAVETRFKTPEELTAPALKHLVGRKILTGASTQYWLILLELTNWFSKEKHRSVLDKVNSTVQRPPISLKTLLTLDVGSNDSPSDTQIRKWIQSTLLSEVQSSHNNGTAAVIRDDGVVSIVAKTKTGVTRKRKGATSKSAAGKLTSDNSTDNNITTSETAAPFVVTAPPQPYESMKDHMERVEIDEMVNEQRRLAMMNTKKGGKANAPTLVKKMKLSVDTVVSRAKSGTRTSELIDSQSLVAPGDDDDEDDSFDEVETQSDKDMINDEEEDDTTDDQSG